MTKVPARISVQAHCPICDFVMELSEDRKTLSCVACERQFKAPFIELEEITDRTIMRRALNAVTLSGTDITGV